MLLAGILAFLATPHTGQAESAIANSGQRWVALVIEYTSSDYNQRLIEGIREEARSLGMRCKDGTAIWIEITFTYISEDKRPSERILGVVRNINDRKLAQQEQEQLQAQLIQAQKMESVGRLAGGVAHDFNNMLSIIIGNGEVALQDIGPSHPAAAYLLEILKAGERSTILTRQLLAFARRQTIAPKVIDLNYTVDAMFSMLQRLIGEDITLSWMPGSDFWPVKIDPSQVDQILANLCVNARDAITDIGKAMEISNKTDKNKIQLLITDVVMPEMNGRELAKRLQRAHPKLKCLFMSGYTSNVIAHHGILEAGLNFINKPFSIQELSVKLREVFDLIHTRD